MSLVEALNLAFVLIPKRKSVVTSVVLAGRYAIGTNVHLSKMLQGELLTVQKALQTGASPFPSVHLFLEMKQTKQRLLKKQEGSPHLLVKQISTEHL